MNTASQHSKAVRGTKRVCQACEVRFYDLSRETIVCPSCGANYTPVARPLFQADARGGQYGGKTGWRSKGFKRPEPAPVVADPEEQIVASEAAAAEDVTEEAVAAVPEDDIVLEQEPDDGDVSGLVDHEVEDPKDR